MKSTLFNLGRESDAMSESIYCVIIKYDYTSYFSAAAANVTS